MNYTLLNYIQNHTLPALKKIVIMEHKNLQNWTDHQIVASSSSSSSYSLKKSTKLLLSLSVFSFLLSHYCYYYSSFMKSSGHFSTITLPFKNFDKNYVFLVFNGILAFIARSTLTSSGSGSLSNSQDAAGFDQLNYDGDDHHRLVIKNNAQDGHFLGDHIATESSTAGESIRVVERSISEEGIFIEDHDDQLDMLYNLQQLAMIKEEEGEIIRPSSSTTTTTNNNDQYDDQYYLKVLEDDQEPTLVGDRKCDAGEEEENGELKDQVLVHESNDANGVNYNINAGESGLDAANSIGAMSTEELNKKFDEFIRRMKEEIRIDAQRQLIMV